MPKSSRLSEVPRAGVEAEDKNKHKQEPGGEESDERVRGRGQGGDLRHGRQEIKL